MHFLPPAFPTSDEAASPYMGGICVCVLVPTVK